MKKMASLLLLAALLCSALLLTGCSPKPAMTAETFCTAMEAAGYTVIDISAQLADVEQVTGAYVARHSSDDYQIEFHLTDTAASAENLYGNNRLTFERTTGGVHSQSSVNGVNYNTFKMTTSGQYRVLVRVDNTLLYIVAP